MALQLGDIAPDFEADTTEGHHRPVVSDEDAKKKFPDGWKAARPYLRIVPSRGADGANLA